MRFKRKKSLFSPSRLASFFILIVTFFLFVPAVYSYLPLEDQLFIDAYKKVLSKAAVKLKTKKVRIRADIMGYEESEGSHKALEIFKNEIRSYLEEEFQIELVSFVPVFSKKHYSMEGLSAPIVEFSLFSDERLALPDIVDEVGDEPDFMAEKKLEEEIVAVKEDEKHDEELADLKEADEDDIIAAPIVKKKIHKEARKKRERVYSENELKSRKYNKAGVESYKNGNYELAFADFIDAVILDSRNIQAHFNLGVAYQMRGRYGEAIVEFQKALSIEDLPRIHVMLGAVYIMQERYDDAMGELKDVVFFGTAKHRISPAGVQAIRQFAKVVKSGALRAPIRVEGHTDSVGTEETNRPISRDRAIAVAMELIAMNSVEPDLVFIRGLGETDPIAPNGSRAGKRLNRRVEMGIYKQKELQ